MTWDQIGALGEILGAAGVIASVLYLAFQVRADRNATLANTRQLRQNGVRESMLAIATSELLTPVIAKTGDPIPPVKALIDEYGLTREEAHRLASFYAAVIRQLETNLKMPMTDDELQQTYTTIKAQLSGPAGVWWQSGQLTFSQEFRDTVKRILDEDS